MRPLNQIRHPFNTAFSLLELLITVLILAILIGVSTPLYIGYKKNAKTVIILQTMKSMQIFQEDLKMRSGKYGTGVYDISDSDNSVTTITQMIGWSPPESDQTVYKVSVTENTYTIVATTLDGTIISRTYP